MSKLSVLKGKVTETADIRNTFNDFPVKALNQQTAASFTLKALICLLIALITLYLYIVLRLYIMPTVYWHNCAATTQVLNTFQNNISNIIL
jgi:hypothetical protein